MNIDYDLTACLNYNPQSFTVEEISHVLAVWEGENEGDDWRWILQLQDGRYVYLIGGCDYTGWDCQSWANSTFADTAELAAIYELLGYIDNPKFPRGLDLKKLAKALFNDAAPNNQVVYTSLVKQIAKGKNETWRDQKDKELGVNSNEPLV